MKTLTVKEFAKEQKFTNFINQVRFNSNNYPYLTFLTADNKAENIYFSKSTAANLAVGEVLTPKAFGELRAVESTNAEGDIRWKLTNSSNRVDIDSFLS